VSGWGIEIFSSLTRRDWPRWDLMGFGPGGEGSRSVRGTQQKQLEMGKARAKQMGGMSNGEGESAKAEEVAGYCF
jgi:hypothetical protein